MESCVTRAGGVPIVSFESSLVSIKSGIFSPSFSEGLLSLLAILNLVCNSFNNLLGIMLLLKETDQQTDVARSFSVPL